MANKGSAAAVLMDDALHRSKDAVQLFDSFKVVNTTEQVSGGVVSRAFRNFSLFLDIDSTGSPTTLQIKVEFLDRWTGKWYTYKQGPFASLFYEDEDTASGIQECLEGMCLGRDIRVTLTGVGTSSSAYFTVSISVDFWN